MSLAWFIRLNPSFLVVNELVSSIYVFSNHHGQWILWSFSVFITEISLSNSWIKLFLIDSTYILFELQFDLWTFENMFTFICMLVLTIFRYLDWNCFSINVNVTGINLFCNLIICYRDYFWNLKLLDLTVNKIPFVFITLSAFLLNCGHILKFRRFFNFMINFDLLFILLLEITLWDIFCNLLFAGSIFHFSVIFNW